MQPRARLTPVTVFFLLFFFVFDLVLCCTSSALQPSTVIVTLANTCKRRSPSNDTSLPNPEHANIVLCQTTPRIAPNPDIHVSQRPRHPKSGTAQPHPIRNTGALNIEATAKSGKPRQHPPPPHPELANTPTDIPVPEI